VLVVVLVACAFVALVVVRDARRAGVVSTVVAAPAGVEAPVKIGPRPRRFTVSPTTSHGSGVLFLGVGTYLQPATARITFVLLDGAGARIARCVFPPSSYHDNYTLVCPVRDVSQARTLVVTRTGSALLTIAAGTTAGYLAVDESHALTGRIGTVLSRIGMALPPHVGAAIVLAALLGSFVLFGLGLALVARREQA
jgi:hypothetical protein